MARIFTNNELKAIMKALMVVWQENDDHEQLGLNMANDLLCKVEVGDKMDSLLTNDENYEFHLHESEWFDDNVADLLKEYHDKKAQEQAREQQAKEMAEKLKAKDLGNGVIEFSMGDDMPTEKCFELDPRIDKANSYVVGGWMDWSGGERFIKNIDLVSLENKIKTGKRDTNGYLDVDEDDLLGCIDMTDELTDGGLKQARIFTKQKAEYILNLLNNTILADTENPLLLGENDNFALSINEYQKSALGKDVDETKTSECYNFPGYAVNGVNVDDITILVNGTEYTLQTQYGVSMNGVFSAVFSTDDNSKMAVVKQRTNGQIIEITECTSMQEVDKNIFE